MHAQELPDPMVPPRLVNDFSGLLSPQEENTLEQTLRDFHARTSNQVYVVTVEDLKGYDISGYAFRLGEQWGIGQKEKDNGILILLRVSPDQKHGKAFIATGYGLEGAVPDAIANRIVDHEMIPRFKEGKYPEGLRAAVNTIMSLAEGEYTAGEYVRAVEKPQAPVPFLIILFIIIALSVAGKSRSARHRSPGHGIPFLLGLTMLSGSRHLHHGSFGDFSSGSGNFGGFGGFSGGGGGSFGGGGAGGSW